MIGAVTGALTDGWAGAASGAIGGATTRGLIAAGCPPNIASVTGSAIGSISSQLINGEELSAGKVIAAGALGFIAGEMGSRITGVGGVKNQMMDSPLITSPNAELIGTILVDGASGLISGGMSKGIDAVIDGVNKICDN